MSTAVVGWRDRERGRSREAVNFNVSTIQVSDYGTTRLHSYLITESTRSGKERSESTTQLACPFSALGLHLVEPITLRIALDAGSLPSGLAVVLTG